MTENIINLTSVHYFYLIGVIVILVTMILKKDILLPCIAFLCIIGFLATGKITGSIQTIFNAIVYAGTSFMDIIVTISLIVAFSKCLSDLGSDYLMMTPGLKVMRTPEISFWVMGITMFIFSLFLWPSPAVALIGATMLPVAIKSGLKPMGAAIAINIFGHGMALSYDFIIQGAPSITAHAANISPGDIIIRGLPIFVTMSVVTALVAFFMYRKDFKQTSKLDIDNNEETKIRKVTFVSKLMAIITPLAFFLDIVAMIILKLKGGDATSLVTGTAVFLMCLGSVLYFKKEALSKIADYVKDGFTFGIKIFAPVMVIAAFFFLGGDGITKILPDFKESTSIINDLAMWISNKVPLNKYPIAFFQMLIGVITGLDGSGFSGLPLVGSLAGTFGRAMNLDVAILSTLGQLTTIWVDGGVLIPWALIPVSAICGVDPTELARKNFIPVMAGFLAVLIVGLILL